MKWLPIGLAALLFAVIAFGLGSVLNQNLKVAPWAGTAGEGRHTPHLKNSTRFVGSPDQVRQDVWRAVYLEDAPPANPAEDWRTQVQAQVQTLNNPTCVVVLPGEGVQALAWAMPGAYWAAYAACPVVFAGRDSLGKDAVAALQKFNAAAFVLAPASLISDQILNQIQAIVPAERVAAESLAAHAVKLASVRKPEAEFGWGRTYGERDGYFDFVVTTPGEARHALAGLPLARSNFAPLLYARNNGAVSAELDRYIWKHRADWFVTPAEGPFRHLWILGDKLTYAAQARLDHALEKGPYESRGATALGPLEGLMIVLIALGFSGGLFVLVHGLRFLPEVPLPLRVAWAFTALLAPILGVVLYFAAYRRPQARSGETPPRFVRPPSIQSAAATAMGFGYGAPLMIVIGWFFLFFGFPLFFGPWADGWVFLFGAGMIWMMVAMWAGAILIAWLAAQLPMARARMPHMPKGKLARKTLLSTALSMSAVSLGMMTMAWWLQMSRLRMMPREDEILWFGAMWLASLIGFLIAWPLNYPMVRTKMKIGTA